MLDGEGKDILTKCYIGNEDKNTSHKNLAKWIQKRNPSFTMSTLPSLDDIRYKRYKLEDAQCMETVRALTSSEEYTSLLSMPSVYKDCRKTPKQ